MENHQLLIQAQTRYSVTSFSS